MISGITATMSDHLPQFLFVPNVLSNPSFQKSSIYERDWSKFVQQNFVLDYFDKDWSDVLHSLDTDTPLANHNPGISSVPHTCYFCDGAMLKNYFNHKFQ